MKKLATQDHSIQKAIRSSNESELTVLKIFGDVFWTNFRCPNINSPGGYGDVAIIPIISGSKNNAKRKRSNLAWVPTFAQKYVTSPFKEFARWAPKGPKARITVLFRHGALLSKVKFVTRDLRQKLLSTNLDEPIVHTFRLIKKNGKWIITPGTW